MRTHYAGATVLFLNLNKVGVFYSHLAFMPVYSLDIGVDANTTPTLLDE